MNIAFCINLLAFTGLGPTISSIIRNTTTSEKLTLWFICDGINEKHKQNLQALIKRENFRGSVNFIDYDTLKEFGKLRSLHGDWTAYARLALPELISESHVLYLDADLIIELDLAVLENLDLQGKPLAAVVANTLSHALDHPFLNGKLGIPLKTSYFNSGVLYIDLNLWRLNNYKDQCLSIARKYPGDLISHDQSLLNAVFHDNLAKLSKKLNSPWYAHAPRPRFGDKMILHFLGSPKPWDIGGRFLHNGYATWKQYEDKEWAKTYNKLTLKGILRSWRIRRSYLRVIKRKFKL